MRCKCGSSIFTYSGIIIGRLDSFTEAKCVECGEVKEIRGGLKLKTPWTKKISNKFPQWCPLEDYSKEAMGSCSNCDHYHKSDGSFTCALIGGSTFGESESLGTSRSIKRRLSK
ncbi:hypothetical protein [Methanobacterium sp.]|uniref:hypothetical protein n=1 Tax=Methanobacterium sp. TaxID=2164 RepID=UPI003C7408E3